jgi:UDP:flavonoid glycosyltransferase YjiC (YdhE family)
LSRILLTWELGLNLGHLARLLPVAAELKARGHAVLVAARDLTAAAYVLAPAEVSFVQSPHLTQGHPLAHRPAGYSDILRAQGWGDQTTLRGLVEGWINLFRMFRPHLVVSDYSPTAAFAAGLADIARLAIGNGFELPPASAPLPPFPGFSWATQEQATESEGVVVRNAAATARCFGRRGIESLREIFDASHSLCVTFPELDHYGSRSTLRYVGPLATKLTRKIVSWPEQYCERKVFVCLRPDTVHAAPILSAVGMLRASVVCVALGFEPKSLESHRSENVVFSNVPVDLSQLVHEADACVSYGAEGTMASFLLGGVPQLVSPQQVETYMALRRLEEQALALGLRGQQSAESVAEAIETICSSPALSASAQQFRDRNRYHTADQSLANIVCEIESAAMCSERRPLTGAISAMVGARQ